MKKILIIDESEWEQYQILEALSEEIFFSYSKKEALLKLSGKNLGQLGCETEIKQFESYLEQNELIWEEDIDQYNEMKYLLQNKQQKASKELRIKTVRDDYEWFEIHVFPVKHEISNQEIDYIGKMRNINKRKIETEKLRTEACVDDLTGLFNHKTAKKMINQYLQSEVEEEAALIFLDLDDFKMINDKLGHQVGDEVIQTVADAIKQTFRNSDITSRIGGDEFTVFMKGVPSKKLLEEKVQDLLVAIRNISDKDVPHYQVHTSIGVARYPKDGKRYRELFEKADKALYTSKGKGKNVITFYDGE